MSLTWHSCTRCTTLLPIDGTQEAPLNRCPVCGEAVIATPASSGKDAWYYARNKKKVGPLTINQLQQLAVAGQLQPSDMVLQEGSRKWLAARECSNLLPAAPNKAAPAILKPQLQVAPAAPPVVKRSIKLLQLSISLAAACVLVLSVTFGYWALKSTFLAPRPSSHAGTSPAVAFAPGEAANRLSTPDELPAHPKEQHSPPDTPSKGADATPTITPAEGTRIAPPDQHEQPSTVAANDAAGARMAFVKTLAPDVTNGVSRVDFLKDYKDDKFGKGPKLVTDNEKEGFKEYIWGDKLASNHVAFLDDKMILRRFCVFCFSKDEAEASVKKLVDRLGKPDADYFPDKVQKNRILAHYWDIKEVDFSVSCAIRLGAIDDGTPNGSPLYFYEESVMNRGAALKKRLKPLDGDSLKEEMGGKDDQAIRDFSETIRLHPDDATAYAGRAAAFCEKSQYERAVRDFTEVIRLEPNNEAAYTGRARANYLSSNLDECIADCTSAIRLDPNNHAAYCNRGDAYMLRLDYKRAVDDYREAIRIDPKNARAYYLRSLAYRSKGDVASAEADRTEAISLDPTFGKK